MATIKLPFPIDMANEMTKFTNRMVKLAIRHDMEVADVYRLAKESINETFDKMLPVLEDQQHNLLKEMDETGATYETIVKRLKKTENALDDILGFLGGAFADEK